MGNPTLSGFIIGLVLVSCFAAIIGLFLADINNSYDIDTTTVNLSKYDKLNDLQDSTDEITNKTTSIKRDSSLTDLIGAFFYQGYQVLVTIPESFNLLTSMTDQGMQDAKLGAGGAILKNTFIIIISILIFVSIILAIILKRGIL